MCVCVYVRVRACVRVSDKQTALQALNQANPQVSQQKEGVPRKKNIDRNTFKQCYRRKY